jgi:diaminopimelate epimerase
VSLPSGLIPFVKASACGNDFLLVAASKVSGGSDLVALTRRLCDRHDGVGADGVEWMYPHPSADLEIRLINSDGSAAEISGNGTRCVAAFIAATQDKQTITIQTGDGLKTCVLTGRSESELEFEVEMGKAVIGSEIALKLQSGEVSGIPISMGNPHCVLIVPKFAENWQERSAEIQRSQHFSHGVNVEMVVIDGEHDIRARFFERGAGETQSSGTGSCASALAALGTGKVHSPVQVHTPGGTQTVHQENGLVYLRGKARLVCRGDFFCRR